MPTLAVRAQARAQPQIILHERQRRGDANPSLERTNPATRRRGALRRQFLRARALPSFVSSLFDIMLRSCSSSMSSVSSSVSPRRVKAPPSASSSADSGIAPAGTRTK